MGQSVEGLVMCHKEGEEIVFNGYDPETTSTTKPSFLRTVRIVGSGTCQSFRTFEEAEDFILQNYGDWYPYQLVDTWKW